MDAFAYISLGLLTLVVLVIVGVWTWETIREPIGQAVVLCLLLAALVVCAALGAVWLIGTKVI
ncbi:hypothetical protein KMT30_45825 [Streptomyces sp. IBSBF 2953]|nr:hypothetical protein [Streptomyces hayashii]